MAQTRTLYPVKVIWTHCAPHWDDLVAIVLLQLFGEALFPGISKAEIKFLRDGRIPGGASALEWLKAGNLAVGVADGFFDEHVRDGKGTERKDGKCSALLVMEYLGIDNDPKYIPLLDFTLKRDNGEVKGEEPLQTVPLIYIASQYRPPVEVLAAVRTLVLGFLDSQDAFFGKERAEFKAQAQASATTITGPRGKKLKIATVTGDFKRGLALFRVLGFHILIQRKMDGHTLVAIDQKLGLKVNELSKIIRHLENRKQGRIQSDKREAVLQFEAKGEHPASPEWFVHPEEDKLCNGTSSFPDVPVTKLSLEMIQLAVRIAFDPTYFQPSLTAKCQAGHCAGKACSWNCFWLRKCEQVRSHLEEAA